MKGLATAALVGCSFALVGCAVEIRSIESELCESLVLREGNLTGKEAICRLRAGVTAAELLPRDSFTGSAGTLRSSLAALANPVGVRLDSKGGKWHSFVRSGSTVEGGCGAESADETPCSWLIRSTSPQSTESLEARIQQIIKLLLQHRMQSGMVYLEVTTGPTQGEYATIAMREGTVVELQWRDPKGTIGFVPAW